MDSVEDIRQLQLIKKLEQVQEEYKRTKDSELLAERMQEITDWLDSLDLD